MLSSVDIFSHLTHEQKHAVESISILRHYSQGETLFYQGEESNYFHFIVSGEVSTYKTIDNERVEIHRLRAPSLIAELAAFQGIPFPASAEAQSDCDILKIARDPFIHLLHDNAGLSIALISSLSQKVASLQRSIEQLMAPDALSKIARLMLEKPEIFRERKGIDIAQIAHITPETLSRIMTRLKKESIINYKPRHYFHVLDASALKKYL